MPVLAEQRQTPHRNEQERMPDVATAISARPSYLIAVLSGGQSSWYGRATAPLPSTMVQPAGFDDSHDDRLAAMYLVPVDEDDDQW